MNKINRIEFLNALSEGCITPYLQPIYHSASRCCRSAEILVRLLHPDKGIILPSNFLDAVESRDEMLVMTIQLMEKIKGAFIAHGRYFKEKFTLAVNIPGSVLSLPIFSSYCQHFVQILSPYNVSLMIELTEHEQLEITDDLLNTIRTLRDSSVSIALDDFGTGYSSLWLLKCIPVDKIKIPMEFISVALSDYISSCIIDSIIELAHKLNLTVTVEGVASEALMQYAKVHDADFIQGFYYSRPLNMAHFFEFCDNTHLYEFIF